MRLFSAVLYGPSAPLLVMAVVAASVLGAVQFMPQGADPGPLTRDSPPVAAVVGPAPGAGALLESQDTISGTAQACLTAIRRGSSSIDLCWQAYRLPEEQDTQNDYYAIEVSASAHGGADGMRWAVVEAESSIGSALGASAFSSLGPGACATLPVHVDNQIGVGRIVLGCERWDTEAALGAGFDRSQQSNWLCLGCLFPVSGDRDVSLVQGVVVPQGEAPTWELGADLGR